MNFLNRPLFFLFGFAVGFLPTLYYLVHSSALTIQNLEPQVAAATVVPTPLTTPEPTVSPTPRATKKPTPTSTPSPAPTPDPTPIPIPTPTPDVWAPPGMEPLFAQDAGQYGVDKNILERLANCESHFNPNAVSGDYVGMFQFSASTWSNYRAEMGFDPNPDLRTNAEESIRTAAYAVLHKGVNPWPRCLN